MAIKSQVKLAASLCKINKAENYHSTVKTFTLLSAIATVASATKIKFKGKAL
jgi:hypothetical protein